MKSFAVVAAVLAALALGACGSSQKVVTDSQSATSSASASTTASATTTATSTSSRTARTSTRSSSAVPAATSRCVAAGLSLSALGQQGAMGHGELGFVLRNTGRTSCHTFGYPGVLFLTGKGRPLPTHTTRTKRDFFGATPTAALVVAPGASVSFRLGVTHGLSSSAGCVTAGQLQVIPPDDTGKLHVSIPHGAYECGTATVSPLRPGASAYP
jgi:hypothetical protein